MKLNTLRIGRVISLIVFCVLLARADTMVAPSVAPVVVDNSWNPIGPQFSTVLALQHDPENPQVMLAGTYFGGLYRSSDYGYSWQHVDAEFSSLSVFSISYTSSSIIYIASFRGGIYRSVDSGVSWVAANNGLTDLDVQAVQADPTDPNVVIAATSNAGVFRSTDKGQNWTQITGNAIGLRGRTIAFDQAHPGVVYLGTIGQGLYKSVDRGLTFQTFSDGLGATSVYSLRFGAYPSHELYAATDNGAFKLRSGDQVWTDISGDLPKYPLSDIYPHPLIEHMVFASTLVGVFVNPNDNAVSTWTGWSDVPTRTLISDPSGSVFHLASIHGGMQGTIDFGRSWYQANAGIQNLFIGALGVSASGSSGSHVYAGSDFAIHRSTSGAWETFFDQKQGIFDIQIDPVNPDTLYIGTERSGVWKSNDGGGEWLPSSTNLVPAHIYSLGQSSDGKTLFAGTSSGLYLSPNNGDFWILGNSTQLGIVLSVAPDPTRYPFLFVGGANGKVLRSEDGGYSYHDASNGLPNENIVSLVTAPWEKTYAITSGGGLFATSDNGLNWFSAKSGIPDSVLAIAADPKQPWILYAGTSGGGVYKSDSGSLTWTKNQDGLTSPYIFSLAVDPVSTNTVYAGTSDGVFKSTDGAVSWTNRNIGLAHGSVTALLVDARNPNVVYASVQDSGIFQSDDGGETWRSVSGGLPNKGAIPIVIDRNTSTRLFAGTPLKGVYRSGDSGGTWQQSNFGMSLFVRGLAIDPSSPSTLYAGSLGAGVFKSTDAGQSWDNVGLQDRNIFKLIVDPQHTGTVFAATSHGVSSTTNGGQTWNELGQKAAFINAMAVDPRNRRLVFIGSTAGALYLSNNGGDTWENANSGLPPYTVVALAVDPIDGTLYAALEQHGVWISTNQGKSWTSTGSKLFDQYRISSLTVGSDQKLYAASIGAGILVYANQTWSLLNNGLSTPNIADIKVSGNGTFFAATFDAGIFRSTDSGMNWSWAGSGLTTSLVNSLTKDDVTPSNIYAATPDGVFLSTDDGITWNPSNTGLSGVNTWSVLIDRATPNHLLAATNGHGIYSSSDSGATWKPSEHGLTNLDVRTILEGSDSVSFYAATLGGGMAHSTDGGTNWSGGMILPIADSFVLALAVNPVQSAIVYAGTSGRGILKSTNGGIDWAPVNNGLGSLFILSMTIDKQNPDTLYAGTADQGVFYTKDAGLTWHELNTGLYNHVVTSLAIDPVDSKKIYAGTEGGGVFANQVLFPDSTCGFTLPPRVLSVDSTASQLSIDVATKADCGWRVDSESDWLTVNGEFSRTGPGTVTLSVASNNGQEARSGMLLVAGQQVLVVQKGSSTLFRLKVSSVGNGSGLISTNEIGIACGADCEQLFSNQLVVSLNASPVAGSKFVAWEGDLDCADGKVTMSSDHICNARFEQTNDFDADGLPNMWEAQFGLDPGSATGDNGPNGDPDHDGISNAQELKNGTHPRGFFVRYFSEGQADLSHSTKLALFNALNQDARVLIHLIPDSGDTLSEYQFLNPKTRRLIDTNDLNNTINGGFAVTIESDIMTVAEETITQTSPVSRHGESAAEASKTWYVTGSSTVGGVTTDISIFNPGSSSTLVRITYLPTSGDQPILREHTIAAGKRQVISVDTDTELANIELSAVLLSDMPIVVESTLKNRSGEAAITMFAAPSPGFMQFFAGMQTASWKLSSIYLLNPTGNTAEVTVDYLLAGGGFAEHKHQVNAFSQLYINPTNDDGLLSDASFGIIASSSSPILMSGVSWWPGSKSADWYAGVGSKASDMMGTNWAIADAELGGLDNHETIISIMNIASSAISVRIKLIFEDGNSTQRDLALPAIQPINVNLAQVFPEALGKNFSALVESLPQTNQSAANIVVDATTYSSTNNIPYSNGRSLRATLIPINQ